MLAEAWLWLAVAAGPFMFGAVEPWSIFLLQALLVLFPLVCALTLPKSGESFLKAPFVPSLLFILALGILQYLSPRSLLGPQIGLLSTVDPPRTAAALVLYACYLAIPFFAPRVLARKGAVRRFAWLLFMLGAAIACLGLLQAAQGNKLIYGLRAVAPDRNPFGPYYNRDHAAALMSMALPIGAGLAFGQLSKWRRAASFEAKANLAAQTALFALPLGALAGALWFILSRGATLGLGCSMLLVFLWSRADTGIKKAVLVLALLGAGATLVRPLLSRVVAVEAAAGPSVATRISMYRSGAKLWQDSPLFGVGLGAFISAFSPYREKTVGGVVDHLHCDWGEAAIEIGLVGSIALIVGFCLFLLRSGNFGGTSGDAENRAVRAGALVAVVACVLHGFVEFGLRIPGNAVYFLAAAALAHAAERQDLKLVQGVNRRLELAPVLAACAFAVMTLGRAPSSDVSFNRASASLQSYQSEPARPIALLHSALAHAHSGIRFDSASPTGNRVTGSVLLLLGRGNDSRLFYEKASAAYE